jgi:serine phosphatase RsbU (regulator of sigma subunit)
MTRRPLSFRTRILLAMLGLVLVLGCGVFAGMELGLRAQLTEALVLDVDATATAFQDVLASGGERLLAEGRVVGEEPRLKAAMSTAGIDRATLEDVGEELRAAVGWDVLALADAGGALVAVRGVDGASPAPDVVSRALGGAPVTGYWRSGARVFLVAATPVAFAERVIGVLVAGTALSDAWAEALARRAHTPLAVYAGTVLVSSSFAAGSAPRAGLQGLGAGPLAREVVLGDERFVTREVALAGATDLRALLLRSEDEALRPYRSLRAIIFSVTGIVLLLAFAAAWLVSRGLSQPVVELETRARSLAHRQGVISEDLRRARDFQRSILPSVPRVDGLDVEVAYRPLDLVGGDVYDVDVSEDGARLRVFIADATGHGVAASLTTMLIKAEYEAVKRVAAGPADVLRALNERIMRAYEFVGVRFTAVCATIDLAGGLLRFATAAHSAPFVLSGSDVLQEEGGGSFVGIVADGWYPQWERPLVPGDVVCLYTDGLTEEWNEGGEVFGEPRLLAAIREAHADGTHVGGAALATLEAFVGPGREMQDDITFIGVRWKNGAARST